MHVVMIGSSDAGISAALRIGEIVPSADVTRGPGRRLPELGHAE
jgi:hypothetical protein